MAHLPLWLGVQQIWSRDMLSVEHSVPSGHHFILAFIPNPELLSYSFITRAVLLFLNHDPFLSKSQTTLRWSVVSFLIIMCLSFNNLFRLRFTNEVLIASPIQGSFTPSILIFYDSCNGVYQVQVYLVNMGYNLSRLEFLCCSYIAVWFSWINLEYYYFKLPTQCELLKLNCGIILVRSFSINISVWNETFDLV